MNNIPPPLPEVSASETIKTTGILHFTIGVRDHIVKPPVLSVLSRKIAVVGHQNWRLSRS
jgi:hypothetical protein